MKNREGLTLKKKTTTFRHSNAEYLIRAYEMVANGLGTGDTMINCITEYLVSTKSKFLIQILKGTPFGRMHHLLVRSPWVKSKRNNSN